MCAVSVVGDSFTQRHQFSTTAIGLPQVQAWVDRQEFEVLKAEVAALRTTLLLAKRIDQLAGQADCEMAEKVALLKAVAKAVGVDLSDVFAE